MDGIIQLSDSDRKTMLALIQRGGEHRSVRRAHVLMLLAKGETVRTIVAMLFCSFDLIASVRRDYHRGGVAAAIGREQSIRRVPLWWNCLLTLLLQFTPRDFGLRRWRWSCEALALVLQEREGIRLGRESVRVILRDLGFVWRRPRPVVGPDDPDHDWKMQQIRRLRANLPDNEVAVYQDEVQTGPQPEDRQPVDAQGNAGRGGDTRRQRSPTPVRIDAGRERSTGRESAGNATELDAVHRPPGGSVPATAAVEGDPCDLRQRRVPQEPGGAEVGREPRWTGGAALSADPSA
jgi:transposase